MRCETLNRPKPDEVERVSAREIAPLNAARTAQRAIPTSDAARERLLSVPGEPLFVADWLRAVFIHYEVPADELQRFVPFELDLFEGKAYVSLVAFTMRGMRPFRGGRLAAWLLKPIATNDYLNVRTYVRHGNEAGIYFLTEWMNNRWSVRLGPWTFGLPYRYGDLRYQHFHESLATSPGTSNIEHRTSNIQWHSPLDPGHLLGSVCERQDGPRFSYAGSIGECGFAPCPAGSLDEFLIERYTAFTAHGNTRRFFRIWHSPWHQTQIDVCVSEDRLLRETWPWFGDATLVGANYSPGAIGVWMGRPHRCGDCNTKQPAGFETL